MSYFGVEVKISPIGIPVDVKIFPRTKRLVLKDWRISEHCVTALQPENARFMVQ